MTDQPSLRGDIIALLLIVGVSLAVLAGMLLNARPRAERAAPSWPVTPFDYATVTDPDYRRSLAGALEAYDANRHISALTGEMKTVSKTDRQEIARKLAAARQSLRALQRDPRATPEVRQQLQRIVSGKTL